MVRYCQLLLKCKTFCSLRFLFMIKDIKQKYVSFKTKNLRVETRTFMTDSVFHSIIWCIRMQSSSLGF